MIIAYWKKNGHFGSDFSRQQNWSVWCFKMQGIGKMLKCKREVFSAKTHNGCSNLIIMPQSEYTYLKVHH